MSHIIEFTVISPDHVSSFTVVPLSSHVSTFTVLTPDHVVNFTVEPFQFENVDDTVLDVYNELRELTFLETARQSSALFYSNELDKLIKSNQVQRSSGLNPYCSLESISDYTDLINYVEIVKRLMLICESSGVQVTADYFKKLFELDKVRQCYVSKNINVQAIYDFYELHLYTPVELPEGTAVPPTVYEGIFTEQFNDIFR